MREEYAVLLSQIPPFWKAVMWSEKWQILPTCKMNNQWELSPQPIRISPASQYLFGQKTPIGGNSACLAYFYCFIFYDWLNLYLWTLTALLAFSKARIFVKDWELYKEFDWKARSVGLTVPFLIKYHFYNSKQRVGRVQWTSCELQLLLL